MQYPVADYLPSNKLAISQLRLERFRNYPQCQLDIGDGPVVLCGPNGAGKTNLMEAISLLAPGRGLRSAPKTAFFYQSEQNRIDKSDNQPGDDQPAWSVFAQIASSDGLRHIGTASHPENPEASRIVRIDDKSASQSQLGEICAVSWLTPQMDGLFLGAASQRRRFLDRLSMSFDQAHAGRVSRFEKAWRQRNKLLSEPPYDAAWLSGLEQILAETGVAILATRIQLLSDLCMVSEQMDSPFPRISGHLDGVLARMLSSGKPAIDIEDVIIETAKQNRQAGLHGMPGPHESDMHLEFSGQHVCHASTGEQKALLISMVLAHAQLQHNRLSLAPILLLDDVAAHLDEDRRSALFGLCAGLDSQIWYSGADKTAFSALGNNAQFIAVEQGSLSYQAEQHDTAHLASLAGSSC